MIRSRKKKDLKSKFRRAERAPPVLPVPLGKDNYTLSDLQAEVLERGLTEISPFIKHRTHTVDGSLRLDRGRCGQDHPRPSDVVENVPYGLPDFIGRRMTKVFAIAQPSPQRLLAGQPVGCVKRSGRTIILPLRLEGRRPRFRGNRATRLADVVTYGLGYGGGSMLR